MVFCYRIKRQLRFVMSGGHFRSQWKRKFFRKIQSGNPISLSERISSHNSTTSSDPLLISKLNKTNPEEQTKASERIVKVVDVQSGGGSEIDEPDLNAKEDENTKECNDFDDSGSSSSSSSCISIDFESETINIDNKRDSEIQSASFDKDSEQSPSPAKKLKIAETVDEQQLATKEHSNKKLETYNFHIID